MARTAALIFCLLAIAHATGLGDPAQRLGALPRLCLFHFLTGLDCPGCGMCRAILQLSRGELGAAARLHPFSPLLVGWTFLAAVVPQDIEERLRRNPWMSRILPALGLATLLGWWLVTRLWPRLP